MNKTADHAAEIQRLEKEKAAIDERRAAIMEIWHKLTWESHRLWEARNGVDAELEALRRESK